MVDPGDERQQGRHEEPAESPSEALARAQQHLRTALAESIRALRALLDATSLATSGAPAGEVAALRRITAPLDELAAQLGDPQAGLSPPLVSAILDALDAEIGRWEIRSQSDPDARAVLRAFIGVREILWEFGLRRDPASDSGGERGARTRSGPAPRGAETRRSRGPRRARVQRVEVQS